MEAPADHAEIRTEFDNRSFVPGETIRGTVTWQTGETPSTIQLRLFHYTRGRGTQDVEIIEEREFPAPMSSGSESFAFALPQGPYSFSGKLVSLLWALELVVGEKGPVERWEFQLSPTGEEVDLYRYAHAEMPDYSTFEITWGKKKRRAGSR